MLCYASDFVELFHLLAHIGSIPKGNSSNINSFYDRILVSCNEEKSFIYITECDLHESSEREEQKKHRIKVYEKRKTLSNFWRQFSMDKRSVY